MDVMFRGKPIDALTREEAIEALKQALDRVAALEGLGPIYLSPLERAYAQRAKNGHMSAALAALNSQASER